MPALRIFLPYEAVPARVQLGYGGTLSRIESTVLRGIVELWTAQQRMERERHGVSLSRLSGMFEIGNRMTLHLVFDLWRRDYVTLDMYGAEVAPTPLVLEAFAQGRQDELTGGEFTVETVDVWLDRVSGHLTGRSGHTHPPDRDLVVPAHPLFSATVDDITGSDLVRAVRETLAKRVQEREASAPPHRPQGRNLRVLEARLMPAQQLTAARRTMWFPVDITVRQDPESDVVRVSVVQDSRRNLAHCERIGRQLTEFLDRRPEHRFSRKLRASLEIRLADPPSLERTVTRLETLAGRALTAAAGTRGALHDSLVEALRTAHSQVGARVDGEADVRLVRTHKDYRAAIRDVIAAADRQVILVASAVNFEGLSDLLPTLRAAVERGTQLVLLWGRGHNETIESRAANALEELRYVGEEGKTGESVVLVSRRPGNVNANMVVADNHTALVGGYPCLKRLDRNADQLGALVTATEPGGCEPVEMILRWVRRAMPDGATASAVYFRERDFARHFDGWVPPSQRLTWSELPSPLELDTAASDTAVRAWALAWRHCAEEVRRHLAARTLPSVTVVEDSAHRDALWEAVRSATAQLVLASETIAPRVVKQPLVDVLAQRVQTGVRADVFYRHVQKHGADARDLLERTADSASGFAVHRSDSAARALIWDDDLIVGSFDFLSHEGSFRGLPGRRPAAEVSLRVTGGGLAQEAATLLGAPAVRRPGPRPVRGDRLDHRSNRLMVELEGCPDPGQRAELVRRAIGQGDPAVLLAELREAEAPDDLLRVVVAAALRGRIDTVGRDLRKWADWLVADLWSRGRFVEAWVLRRALPDGALPLLPAAAAAAANTAHLGEALETAALQEPPSPGHTAALMALGVSQLLAWSGTSEQPAIPPDLAHRVRETLGFLVAEGRARPCWKKLAELARQCPQGIVENPGPAVVARRQLVWRDRGSRLTEAWDEMDEALATAGATNFRFEAGLKTHEHLFHAQGLFGELRTVLNRRDVTGAAQWAGRPEVADLAAHVDRTTAELMAGHKNNVIHSSKRRVYLDRLRQVKGAAGVVAAFHDAERDVDMAYQVTEARPTAIRLAEVWPELHADLHDHPAPERHLTEHALTALTDIREWGSGECGTDG
ncbi:hypothetical protein SAMN04487981_1155 [Streptomyces sp. cf386]|uniref:hypothetical protein n=1 Tax=Streptomyces sp. cf386 TaxID=1761904 RepID=UPI0008828F17|nr:hypothetical protein [Streptomyces sp. cf386]SDO95441.1 hypothetical protein SAMN04487981_1155 [Streptomyces sp. cf386]